MRVKYPIKTALVEFENSSVFDIENETDKFCVSWFYCQIASYGLQVCTRYWNSHPIPGKLDVMKSDFLSAFFPVSFQYSIVLIILKNFIFMLQMKLPCNVSRQEKFSSQFFVEEFCHFIKEKKKTHVLLPLSLYDVQFR